MTMRKSSIAVALLLASLPAFALEPGAVSPSPFAVTLLMRWTHILSAIAMLGGSLFVALILRAAAKEALDDAARATLTAAVRKRWKLAVMILTTLLLVSGFYNYLMVLRFNHPDQPLYHALFGIKFLLSMVVFALAMFLVGSTGLGRRLQADEGRWLGVLVSLAVMVVLIGGYMKVM